MKEKLRKINKITIISVSIAFILGILLHLYSIMIILCILNILFIFGLYVYLYPKACFIERRNEDDYRLPWISIIASMIILIVYTSFLNFDITVYFLSCLPLIIILMLIYIFKLIKIKRIDAKRFILVFIAVVAISLCVTVPFNSLLPIIDKSTVKVEVLSKSYATAADYEKNFSLYLRIGNSTKRFNVSKKKYKNLKENDYVLVVKKTNLFGMIFYEVL